MKEVRGWGGGGIAGATFCHPVGKKLRMCKVAKLPSRALQYATKEQVGEKKRSLAVALLSPPCDCVEGAVRERGCSPVGLTEASKQESVVGLYGRADAVQTS